jgi:hypothetical protein
MADDIRNAPAPAPVAKGPETPPAAQTAPPQAVPAPSTPPVKPEPPKSKGWSAQLSREQKLKSDRDAFQAEREAFAKERKEIDSFKASMIGAKKNPLALLKAAGITTDQLNDVLLGKGETTPDLKIQALEEEFANYKKAQEEAWNKRIEEEQTAEQTEAAEATKVWMTKTATMVNTATDKFPLVSLLGQGALVAQAIANHYEETGEEWDVETVAKNQEESLLKTLPAEFDKMLKSPAAKVMLDAAYARLTPEPEPKKETPKKAPAKTVDGSLGVVSRPKYGQADKWTEAKRKLGIIQ